MAKATKIEAVVQVVQPEGYTLELSKVEAGILLSLLGECLMLAPTHPIYTALSVAGVKATHVVRNELAGWKGLALNLTEKA